MLANRIFIVVSTLILFYGWSGIAIATAPPFRDEEILSLLKNWHREHFEDEGCQLRLLDPIITIVKKEVTSNRELKIKVKIKGNCEKDCNAGDLEIAKKRLHGSKDYDAFLGPVRSEYYSKERIFYVTRNNAGKTKIFDEDHLHWFE